jgi:hypothetical protein
MAWSRRLENLYNKAELSLAFKFADDFADFFIEFVKSLERNPNGYGIVFPKGETYVDNKLAENLHGCIPATSDYDWAGIHSAVLKDLHLELLKTPVFVTMLQKLRKIPDVEIEIEGPRMLGGMDLPTIEYQETYHFDDSLLRLRGGLESYAASISDEVNRALAAEQINRVDFWNLYKKIA